MSRFILKSMIVLFVVLAEIAASQGADAPVPVKAERSFEQHITLDQLGDADVRLQWQLPAGEFLALKKRVSTISKVRDKKGNETVTLVGALEGLSHFFNLDHLGVFAGNIKMTVDDSKKQITASFKVSGWARTTTHTTWTLELLDNARWYQPLETTVPPVAGATYFAREESPPGTVRVGARGASNGVAISIRTEVKLPQGASWTKFFKNENGLWTVSYRLPRPVTKGEEDGDLDFQIKPRREILPALHKIYGDPTWPAYYLARTKFANSKTEAIEHVRIRSRVSTSAGQTNWSDWEETARVVYPGQSVQYPLHPVLDARALLLTSQERGKLSVELEYTHREKTFVKSRTARLTILGRNDLVGTLLSGGELRSPTFHHTFQEYPVVVAAFVTPNDQVVKDLKGQLSTHIGGPATDNDRGATKFAAAIYDYFRANLSYSSPTATLSEDGRLVQHVNYPRNVLKAGSGTCIDLAVTYASIAEASGLKVGVCVVPGHALPYIILPQSKRVLFIDVVGCMKGTLEGSLSFAEALRRGNVQAQKDTFVLANMSVMRQYVSGPELPQIESANPLKDWGRALPPAKPEVAFGAVKVRHNVKTNGILGMQFFVPLTIDNGQNQDCTLMLAVRDVNGKPYLDKDGQQHIVRVSVRPPTNEYKGEMTVSYPYEHFAALEEGVWHERRLEVWAWSALYKEPIAAQIVTDRMVLQRIAAKKDGDKPTVRSVLFQTRSSIDAKGKKGVELLIKDVQLGDLPAGGASTVVSPIGGPKGGVLKKSDGTLIQREADRVGQTTLWFGDEELREFGAGEVKGLMINFWDKSKREWLMPTGVKVTLKP